MDNLDAVLNSFNKIYFSDQIIPFQSFETGCHSGGIIVDCLSKDTIDYLKFKIEEDI